MPTRIPVEKLSDASTFFEFLNKIPFWCKKKREREGHRSHVPGLALANSLKIKFFD